MGNLESELKDILAKYGLKLVSSVDEFEDAVFYFEDIKTGAIVGINNEGDRTL